MNEKHMIISSIRIINISYVSKAAGLQIVRIIYDGAQDCLLLNVFFGNDGMLRMQLDVEIIFVYYIYF